MARISGVDLPNNKRVEIALSYIYGIGRPTGEEIVAKLKIKAGTKVKDLTDEQIAKIRDEIDKNHKVEGDLRREQTMAIKRLMDINCVRGARHRKGLPVRGQRTKTNAKTSRKLAARTITGVKKEIAASKAK